MSPQKEFSPARLVLTIMVVTFLSGLVLAGVRQLTEKPIQEALAAEKKAAIATVLPEGAQPSGNTGTVELDGVEHSWFPAESGDGTFGGLAVETWDNKGYSGEVKLMVGLDAQGKLSGFQALVMNETPGLGDGILKAKFQNPLLNKGESDMEWQVKKDGGDVDAVTAATISSRSALACIRQAFAIYEKLKANNQLSVKGAK